MNQPDDIDDDEEELDEEDDHEEEDDFEIDFADPGGRSSLRAETPENPRNLPCPTCKRPDQLTPADVAQGYQCNHCADRDDGLFPSE